MRHELTVTAELLNKGKNATFPSAINQVFLFKINFTCSEEGTRFMNKPKRKQ